MIGRKKALLATVAFSQPLPDEAWAWLRYTALVFDQVPKPLSSENWLPCQTKKLIGLKQYNRSSANRNTLSSGMLLQEYLTEIPALEFATVVEL